MKTTMILATLFGCSLAAPSNMRWAKRQTGPSQSEVVAAINSWNSDVAMVNNFLNTPPTTGNDYAGFASLTLGFAKDEPNELVTLASIPALSTDATNAIQDLRTVFGRVLTNLQDIIDNQNNLTIIKQDIYNINEVRCCNILPNLDVLWAAAADAEGVSNLVNLVAPNENACAAINC
jgi:hypothetical protein